MVWSVERVTTPTLPASSPTPPSNCVPPNTEQGTEADIEDGYALVLRGIYTSLRPGGHVLIGDHTQPSHPGIFRHLELLKEAGFTDVDVAWVHRDWFVVGARRPLTDVDGVNHHLATKSKS